MEEGRGRVGWRRGIGWGVRKAISLINPPELRDIDYTAHSSVFSTPEIAGKAGFF